MTQNLLPSLDMFYSLRGYIDTTKDTTSYLLYMKSNGRYDLMAEIGSGDNADFLRRGAIAAQLSAVPNSSPFPTFYGTFLHNGKIALVFDSTPGMKLKDLFNNMRPIEAACLLIARSCCEQLKYLHDRNFAYGNFSFDNVYINRQSGKITFRNIKGYTDSVDDVQMMGQAFQDFLVFYNLPYSKLTTFVNMCLMDYTIDDLLLYLRRVL